MDVTHTFPVPEAETRKLTAVADELSHQPVLTRLTDSMRATPWRFVVASLILGAIFGKAIHNCIGSRSI